MLDKIAKNNFFNFINFVLSKIRLLGVSMFDEIKRIKIIERNEKEKENVYEILLFLFFQKMWDNWQGELY